MGNLSNLMRGELQFLLDALSDGLRQEVRQRQNWSRLLPHKYDMSITGEREIGIASSLSTQLRLAGYIVQVESYVTGGDNKRRPDFGIWLPESRKYIYLELKLCAWGGNDQYRYDYAINEIEKLNNDLNLRKHPHGLISIGFSRASEEIRGVLWESFNKLSQDIINKFPYTYEEIGLRSVDFKKMDDKTTYAIMGLWFRREWGDVEVISN